MKSNWIQLKFYKTCIACQIHSSNINKYPSEETERIKLSFDQAKDYTGMIFHLEYKWHIQYLSMLIYVAQGQKLGEMSMMKF